MCVGISAKVIQMKGNVAIVDATGAKRSVSAELLDDYSKLSRTANTYYGSMWDTYA